jgi:isopentenyl-diphosphate delta-isomerase
MLHRAFSVFLFNSRGELMLQQRAKCKITFPLRWTNTCCSHPLYGTNEVEEAEARGVKRAAIRKLEHELGIKNELKEEDLIWLTKIHYGAESDGEWGEHEIDWILFVQKDVKHELNLNEVESIEYVTINRLKEMFQEQKQGKLLLTPWFHLIAEKLLFGWWEKLDQIMKERGLGEEQKKIIHRLKFE